MIGLTKVGVPLNPYVLTILALRCMQPHPPTSTFVAGSKIPLECRDD